MRVVVLDDSELNNLLMTEALRSVARCEPIAFLKPREAMAFIADATETIGAAIVDYDMPDMNGLEVIEAARSVPGFAHVPIMMVTGNDQRALRRSALQAGATDFLTKPIDAVEVAARVTNLLALDRARRAEADRATVLADEVAKAVAVVETREREIVTLLMKAAEHRDSETGDHVGRVADYVTLIAEGLRLPPEQVRALGLASTMHDIGKLSVPDAILLKPGPLDAAERAAMERHALIGGRILDASTSDMIRLAAEIARTHHERWDGTGYPKGLRGEEIPLSGRITAVADVFDALTSDRPYKAAWTPERARETLILEAGRHFDPDCVAAFVSRWPSVLERLGPKEPRRDLGAAVA